VGMILYLVRHGRTLGGEGRCVGHCDLEMDPAAAVGLRSLAASFPAAPPPRLISSDLRRASTTLSALAERWSAPIEMDPRLREMDFGEWDGRSWSEIRSSDGERLQRWMDGWTTERAPGGESFTQVADRTARWLDELGRSDSSEAVVVAHAGSIRAMLCGILRLPLERAFRLRVDHGRVSAVELGDEPTLLFLNADRIPAP
jgi:broad specificity phosphatase PhoE